MDRTIHTARATTTVGEAAVLMARANIGSILVMDGDRLVGILTERGVVQALSRSIQSPADPVRLWMATNPETIHQSSTVADALEGMLGRGVRHLPVVDDDGHVVGMLSMTDVARAGLHGPREGWPRP